MNIKNIMGCAICIHKTKIQRSTAIEILDENDIKDDPTNVVVAKFKANGKHFKVHFREVFSLVSKS